MRTTPHTGQAIRAALYAQYVCHSYQVTLVLSARTLVDPVLARFMQPPGNRDGASVLREPGVPQKRQPFSGLLTCEQLRRTLQVSIAMVSPPLHVVSVVRPIWFTPLKHLKSAGYISATCLGDRSHDRQWLSKIVKDRNRLSRSVRDRPLHTVPRPTTAGRRAKRDGDAVSPVF